MYQAIYQAYPCVVDAPCVEVATPVYDTVDELKAEMDEVLSETLRAEETQYDSYSVDYVIYQKEGDGEWEYYDSDEDYAFSFTNN